MTKNFSNTTEYRKSKIEKSKDTMEKINFSNKILKTYEKNSFFFFFLFKKAEDFLNEEFVTIHLSQFDKIFREEQLNIWINPFLIQSLSFNSGFMEIIPNSLSIHDLRKNFGNSKIFKKKKKKMQKSLLNP
mmetsp:Transcript_33452/g.84538  ORF Transcript_33452/g.84538 Transcript_33452/m.84538 type:complete len:131 (-) Transcript_33452:1786-2178(-)